MEEVFTSKAIQLLSSLSWSILYLCPIFSRPHRIRNWKSGTKLSFTKAFQKAVNTLQFSLQHSLFSLLLAKMSEMYLLANRGNESTEQSAKHIFTGCYDAFVILRLNIFKDNRQRDAAQSTESTLSRLGWIIRNQFQQKCNVSFLGSLEAFWV